MSIVLLDQAIQKVCPTHGISIGRKDDKSTWRIDFKDEATQAEKDAAQLVVDNFDINAKDPIEERIKEYGTPAEQLERIIENGLAAEQANVADIKARHPK
jgi:hypothetical protein